MATETSNGTFKTMKVGDLKFLFPDFSQLKLFKVCPNIVGILSKTNKPVFDPILGAETMTKLGILVDFSQTLMTLDCIKLIMRPLKAFMDANALNDFHRDHLETTSTKRQTKSTVQILDAKYKNKRLTEPKLLTNTVVTYCHNNRTTCLGC